MIWLLYLLDKRGDWYVFTRGTLQDVLEDVFCTPLRESVRIEREVVD